MVVITINKKRTNVRFLKIAIKMLLLLNYLFNKVLVILPFSENNLIK